MLDICHCHGNTDVSNSVASKWAQVNYPKLFSNWAGVRNLNVSHTQCAHADHALQQLRRNHWSSSLFANTMNQNFEYSFNILSSSSGIVSVVRLCTKAAWHLHIQLHTQSDHAITLGRILPSNWSLCSIYCSSHGTGVYVQWILESLALESYSPWVLWFKSPCAPQCCGITNTNALKLCS